MGVSASCSSRTLFRRLFRARGLFTLSHSDSGMRVGGKRV